MTPSFRRDARVAIAALAALTALGARDASAQTTWNVGIASDYRYRGISQSRLKPALQGGVDWSQPGGGFYAGAWASTIRWVTDIPGGDAALELDVYGGHKGQLAPGLGYDLGLMAYVYPSNRLTPSANTAEIYAALSHGAATLKISHALTNTFGNPSSRKSFYADLSFTLELGDGWTLMPHLGHQRINGPAAAAASYSDLALTLTKDFDGWVPSLALVATDADRGFYLPGAEAASNRFLGRSALVLALKKNF